VWLYHLSKINFSTHRYLVTWPEPGDAERASHPLSTHVKPRGCIMFVLARGCLQVSPAGASPHGLSSSCSVSGRNLGRHTSVTLYGPLVAYYVRHLVWLRAARFQSLDFFAQVAGEVCAVCRLEVTKGFDGSRETIPLPVQVVERFSAAIFNLTIELLSATVCIGIETLCIDPGFGLDPGGTVRASVVS
jgi:hypothetical protein